jgi:hypothetical protein
MQNNNKFLYFHIPKTGGVAFRQILENSVNANEILHFRTPSEIANHSDSSLEEYRLVHGHFNSAHIKQLTSFKTIITLREALPRCLSTYNFWAGLNAEDSSWPESSKLQIRRAQSLSLDEMIVHPDPFTRQHFNNMQTRLLSGITNSAEEVTESHFSQAVEKLLTFDFIATNEDLSYCMMLMCKKFDLFYPNSPSRLNESKKKTRLTSEMEAKLTESNKFDIKLLGLIRSRGLENINFRERN